MKDFIRELMMIYEYTIVVLMVILIIILVTFLLTRVVMIFISILEIEFLLLMSMIH